MRKDFGAKTYVYPQPVLIIAAYDEDGSVDAMNAAWGGISNDTELSMCLSPNHKTVKNIFKSKAFTVSMGTVATMQQCDYLGVVSGNQVTDKFEHSGFHAEPSAHVHAPLIKELPLAVECTLTSYDPESCRMVGEIVNATADESILDENGSVDPKKLQPITFDPVNHGYLALGEQVGHAFKDGLKLK